MSVYTEEIGYQIEVLEDGQLQVRKATHVLKDGVRIAKSYHRHVLAPDDETGLPNEVQRVKDIANAVWTQEVKDKYKAKQAEQNAKP